MPIELLPVFEADADHHHRSEMTDEEQYAALVVPESLVVRFGYMKQIAELPYKGDIKPGCGTKLVARTYRGAELVEMLTTTCDNSGCGKAITRAEMLEYIENSGGEEFPFYTDGQILRIATIEDMNQNSNLESKKREWVKTTKEAVIEYQLDMKIVEVEPILSEEVLTIYFMAEERIDFRELVKHLASQFQTRIEMRQIGARDEARLNADFERCGQHCCCKGFLKVLKPVSMRAAKMQKATLDPLKISGRCGRLMCCLRYEDQSYRELKQNLPHRKTRVGTKEGPGIVLDSRILAQLVLVQLEHDNREIAVPIEELMDPETCPTPEEALKAKMKAEEEDRAAVMQAMDDPFRGMDVKEVEQRTDDKKQKRRGRRKPKSRQQQQQAHKQKELQAKQKPEPTTEDAGKSSSSTAKEANQSGQGKSGKRRRKRRRGSKGRGNGSGNNSSGNESQSEE